jgi:WS/DGAT/MGAT family acyltransferase
VNFSERLSALDASFLAVEDEGTHMHVAAVLLFEAGPLRRPDGGLDIECIREWIAARLHLVPRYRQKLASVPLAAQPVWVDDLNFNLQYHVRHTCLPPPADERLLKRLAGRIMSQKLDRGKPLWEVWAVEGLEGDRFALVTKAHHCMVDGISGIDLIATLLRPNPEMGCEPAPRWFPRPAPSGSQLLADEIRHRARAPLAFLERTRNALRDPLASIESARNTAAAIGETIAAGLRPASRTPLNPVHIGPHRRFDWIAFDLNDVKRIKNHLGGTINDVVLATVAGAIGTYLQHRRVGVQGLDFRAMIPVNLRPLSDRGSLGNRVAVLLAELPIGEPDPRRRLRRVIETMERMKQSGQVRGSELLEELSDWTAPAILNQTVRMAARVRAFNLVVTNVPGPDVPLYLCGAPLLEPYPVVPLYSNQALAIALFSYHGGLYWGFNSDWDRIPDLHELVDALALHFQELCKAASAAEPRAQPAGKAEGQAASRQGRRPRSEAEPSGDRIKSQAEIAQPGERSRKDEPRSEPQTDEVGRTGKRSPSEDR